MVYNKSSFIIMQCESTTEYGRTVHLKHIVDNYISYNWTERFGKVGEFQLDLPFNQNKFNNEYRLFDYIFKEGSTSVMVIQTKEVKFNGDKKYISLSGKSFENFLDTKIILENEQSHGPLDAVIKYYINKNIITPADSNRKINGVTYVSATDPGITSIGITTDESIPFNRGTTLLTVVNDILTKHKVWFYFYPEYDNIDEEEHLIFKFGLTKGQNRSHEQTENDTVILSQNNDSLISDGYLVSIEGSKSTNYVLIEDSTTSAVVKLVIVNKSTEVYTGIFRREMMLKLSDTEEDRALVDSQLTEKGNVELDKDINSRVEDITGETIEYGTYIYKRDYFLGDIISIETVSGEIKPFLVVEHIESGTENGEIVGTPTFELYKDEEAIV